MANFNEAMVTHGGRVNSITASIPNYEGNTMNLQESHIQELRGLIEQSPALLEQLKQCKSMGESAKVLAEAARQKGLDIDEASLSAYYEQAAKQVQSSALSDAQLDAVAGGFTQDEWLVISIASLGLGCATLSLTYTITRGGCY
jgi:hypothetical protein